MVCKKNVAISLDEKFKFLLNNNASRMWVDCRGAFIIIVLQVKLFIFKNRPSNIDYMDRSKTPRLIFYLATF